ncbi:MAG: sterol desaturase family protein [Deltaproteobacteria bacterium]|nr:sterol desaturase family protein [Nannocystaceae bacterium]
MELLSLVLFPGSLIVFFALDLLRPARHFVAMPRWRVRGLLGLLVFLTVAMLAPLAWDAWLGEHRLLDTSALPLVPACALALLGASLLSYFWHRALHRVPLLWRSHQLHHSAERVDIFGAFLFHPLDTLGFTLMGSLAMTLVLGVAPGPAMFANGVLGFCAAFQHANLRTPTWLGWFIQRPESHALHHQRGVHGYNYGDIAIWDRVFGTYRNPERWSGLAGFYDGASRRVGEMLLGIDVSRMR